MKVKIFSIRRKEIGVPVLWVFLFWLIGGSSAFAQAQEYPTKPIRIIVPLSAGAGADIAARIIAQRMNEHWKQPVIVENRPGAGGQIGTAAVVKAEPDGHTLMVQSSSHAANSAIYKSLPYDPLTDLVDVAMIGKTPYVMVSAASGPYKTLKSLIDAAKAKPGELAFASAGMGTSTHLASEYLLGLAGVRMIHLPFKGSPEALQDVLGGRAAFYMAPVKGGESGQGGQAERPGGLHQVARGGSAGGADHRGAGAAGLRGDALVRHVGARGHLDRDREEAQ